MRRIPSALEYAILSKCDVETVLTLQAATKKVMEGKSEQANGKMTKFSRRVTY